MDVGKGVKRTESGGQGEATSESKVADPGVTSNLAGVLVLVSMVWVWQLPPCLWWIAEVS